MNNEDDLYKAPEDRPDRSGLTDEEKIKILDSYSRMQNEKRIEQMAAAHVRRLHFFRWTCLILILLIVGYTVWHLPDIVNWFSRH